MKKQEKAGEGHHKSIRKRLTGTVLVPSITLIVMWVVLSAYFVINGVYVRTVASSVQDVSIPAVTALGAVQQERQLSLIYLDRPGVGLGDLQEQQQTIDRSLTSLRAAMTPVKDMVPDEIAQRMTDLESSLDQLPVVRTQIALRTVSKSQVNDFYNKLIDTAAGLFDAQARTVPDVTATQGAIGATEIFRASDSMSRAASLATSAFAAGSLSVADHLQFSQLVGSYRAALTKLAPFMVPEVGKRYQDLTSSDAWQRLSADEDAIITHGPGTFRTGSGGFTVTETDWRSLTDQVAGQLVGLTVDQADRVSSQALTDGNANLRNAIIGSAVALLAAVASIYVAVRVSRTLVDRTLLTRLERLRNDSLELARTRLPGIVGRLKEGQPVDVSAELPRLDHGQDEIGQVAEAFNMAQLTAVSAAASEAKARSGVNNVFLGIAHRNQGLVHRQLQILDRMESQEENPAQLKGLFQLDHLATRARRTTENLIILGGKQPGRRWRKPVWLMDVLRAAVSETEHFSRVEVENVPQVAVIGSAVADTIHLIAELVDNATTFSPPGSQVHMTSTLVARGVVVDVADQGLGMKDETREWANRMMSEPPEFDAMALKADASLGLFVVARLAARLGVRVMFDSSRYGGTRATILIPTELVSTDGQVADNADSEFRGQPAQVEEPEPVAVGAGRHREVESAGRVPVPSPVRRTTMTSEPEPEQPAPGQLPRRVPGPVTSAQPEPVAAAEPKPKRVDRAPLPQREPQQNLVDQLREDPEAEPADYSEFEGRTLSTISKFHKGTQRGRAAEEPAEHRATTE
ncbi:nitrate- and nitrite sensing domain-containing protein [Amycolatopsis sp.]|uniref:nitrate- and nitrite sensing domain-containing protein n=1 Tax=Amycolatopsis sp. TaxID=37632 RepID=UPI002B8D6B18|nr:nitrate- and nitrite sensing domain-containing protein [Amycolatopsis sp.]HVV08915.1 nitrate- and nitrite sensing domain-containing protein [Amycolatopsis sp.]